jgi:hypothetical protein
MIIFNLMQKGEIFSKKYFSNPKKKFSKAKKKFPNPKKKFKGTKKERISSLFLIFMMLKRLVSYY